MVFPACAPVSDRPMTAGPTPVSKDSIVVRRPDRCPMECPEIRYHRRNSGQASAEKACDPLLHRLSGMGFCGPCLPCDRSTGPTTPKGSKIIRGVQQAALCSAAGPMARCGYRSRRPSSCRKPTRSSGRTYSWGGARCRSSRCVGPLPAYLWPPRTGRYRCRTERRLLRGWR